MEATYLSFTSRSSFKSIAFLSHLSWSIWLLSYFGSTLFLYLSYLGYYFNSLYFISKQLELQGLKSLFQSLSFATAIPISVFYWANLPSFWNSLLKEDPTLVVTALVTHLLIFIFPIIDCLYDPPSANVYYLFPSMLIVISYEIYITIRTSFYGLPFPYENLQKWYFSPRGVRWEGYFTFLFILNSILISSFFLSLGIARVYHKSRKNSS